jgi:hypothetical protein
VQLRTRPDEPGLVRDDDRLGAAAQVELREDASDVGLHGGLRDDERAGDLVVGQAVADEREDLELAWGEIRKLGALCVLRGWRRSA